MCEFGRCWWWSYQNQIRMVCNFDSYLCWIYMETSCINMNLDLMTKVEHLTKVQKLDSPFGRICRWPLEPVEYIVCSRLASARHQSLLYILAKHHSTKRVDSHHLKISQAPSIDASKPALKRAFIVHPFFCWLQVRYPVTTYTPEN